VATTAIWKVTDRLDRVLNYATNPQKTESRDFDSPDFQGLRDVLGYTTQDLKTEKQLYVTGIRCDPVTACEQMERTKFRFQKTDGILAFHGYQAFYPGETTPEVAHEIGVRLAKKLWGDSFEVVVSTHLDKHHLHNHFVVNSVSFMDGKRFYDNLTTYAEMRRASDTLCKEYALSVIENPQKGKSKHYAEWKAEHEGKPTWRSIVRADMDAAISMSTTITQFRTILRKQGYEVKTCVKYMAVRPPGKERFIRLWRLGDNYTENAINERILNQQTPKRAPPLPEPERKQYRMKGSLKKAKKVTGLQALYLSYLYKMGVLPKHHASVKRTHFILREDLRYLDQIIAETKLLCVRKISDKGQLLSFQSDVQQKIKSFADSRTSLYNRLRHCTDQTRRAVIKEEISSASNEITGLRKEARLCDGILTRSEPMRQKLAEVNRMEMEQQKEEQQHEQQRSGRSGREHEPQRH
jgi:hypothetical protein